VTGRSAPSYGQLLAQAQELGRVDGRFAAAFEPAGNPLTGVAPGPCLGRSPAEFARLLWAGGSGEPPAGLEQNAPNWYATGFAEGLAERRAEQLRAEQLRAELTHFRWVLS
jgi:hypothetical protein